MRHNKSLSERLADSFMRGKNAERKRAEMKVKVSNQLPPGPPLLVSRRRG